MVLSYVSSNPCCWLCFVRALLLLRHWAQTSHPITSQNPQQAPRLSHCLLTMPNARSRKSQFKAVLYYRAVNQKGWLYVSVSNEYLSMEWRPFNTEVTLEEVGTPSFPIYQLLCILDGLAYPSTIFKGCLQFRSLQCWVVKCYVGKCYV